MYAVRACVLGSELVNVSVYAYACVCVCVCVRVCACMVSCTRQLRPEKDMVEDVYLAAMSVEFLSRPQVDACVLAFLRNHTQVESLWITRRIRRISAFPSNSERLDASVFTSTLPATKRNSRTISTRATDVIF